MATQVDICNLALSRIGDEANVVMASPSAEESVQAAQCARFYPMARDTLLEMFPWNFALRRRPLALRENMSPMWCFTYAAPEDMIRFLRVLPPLPKKRQPPPLFDDDEMPIRPHHHIWGDYPWRFFSYSAPLSVAVPPSRDGVPIDFAEEVDEGGCVIIMTDMPDATGQYVAKITDTSKFTPLFTDALSWLLASYLAGAIIKGDVGIGVANACQKNAMSLAQQAMNSDVRQRKVRTDHNAPWIVARG